VQIGPANAASGDSHKDLVFRRHWIGNRTEFERLADLLE
jgi:hypothetical protein